jgi:hypothetical protein
MRYAAETGRTIAMALVNRLEAPSGPLQAVDEVIARLSRRAPEYRSAALPDGELLASPLGTLLGEAAAIAGGPSELHMRHILVAAVMRSALPPALFDELGMSPEELRQALREAIEELGLDEPELVQALVIDSLELEGGISEDLVDPTEALDLSQDHLGVRDYVTMFAGVIAHDETPMPLSIGLFGEWGSGKSYFMALLRGQIETLRKSGDPHYLREIRQIGFNAWTYADSNLWASLGDEIFAQLAGPGETDERRRQRLQTELSDGLQRRRELAAATEHAKEETARLSGEIDEAARDRGVRARALTAALGAELDRQAQTAFKRIGVDDEIEQSRLLSDELRGAPADVAVIRRSLSGQRAIVLAACAVLTLAAIGVGAAASWDWLVGSGAAALVAVVGAASWLAARVRSGLGVLHRVADGVRQKAAGDDEVQAKLAQLKQAEAQEQVLRAQLDEIVARVGELGRELAELSPGQRLYSFVAERAASDDYRRQLGLISTIRKDLTQLVGLLGKRDSDPDAPPPIERIVLYIDDLDRCSPEQVVQVLQAVHLLLALDLFVVVVGVDPRWLLRALRREYEAMLTGHASDAGEDEWWQTTPQDYLEKIFNIPFALPRMSTTSFDLLVRTLAAPRTRKEEEEEEEPPLAETVAVEAPDAAAETPEQRPDTAPRLEVEAGSVVEAIQRGETPRPEDQARPLSEPELELLSSLAPLVETPREAKRLLNLYRMIRSTRNLTPAARFLGSEDQPGEYQAVVILLGLLSGHARQLEDVLVAAPENGRAGGLRHRTSGTWAEFVADIKPRQTADGWENDIVGAHAKDDLAGWQRLADGLAPATELVTIADLEPFQRWAPLIARFSFLLSPYAGQDEPKPG